MKTDYHKQLVLWRARRVKIRQLVKAGKSVTEVARELGISKQRVSAIVRAS